MTEPAAKKPQRGGKARGPKPGPGAIPAGLSQAEQDLARHNRARQVWEARKLGHHWTNIAAALGISISSARDDLRWLLSFDTTDVTDLRRETAQRYDDLIAAWWPLAIALDQVAVPAVLRAMSQKARLLGLDRPAADQVALSAEEVVTRFEAMLANEAGKL